jgi:hypothetical protein
MCVLQVMTAPIRAFVDMIINMIVGWYLWPSRLTVSRLTGLVIYGRLVAATGG